MYGSVSNLHATHILGNIQGGTTGATETVTIQSASGTASISITDDESLNSIIQKIKDTGKYDAGISGGKFWIQSLTDSTEKVVVSDSNFARIVGLNGDSETLGTGTLTVGSLGTMSYTGAAIAGLQGSTNLTIDAGLTGNGDGSFRVTLSDKNTNTITVATKTFDVSITENMTVDEIMTAIKTASINAGVTDLDIYFDDSTHQVKLSISANQAEQITFTGSDAKGSELVKRLGLATSNTTTTKNGTNKTGRYFKRNSQISSIHSFLMILNCNKRAKTIKPNIGAGNIK